MKIYTRTGDAGDTALFDGTRVRKSDARIGAFGDIDELSAWLGVGYAAGLDDDLEKMIVQIQRDLFALGARLADPAHKIAERVSKAAITTNDIARLETWIDTLDAELSPLRQFILPGGAPAAASLHVARAICRRAERAMVALDRPAPPPELLTYINRLSDLLFVMARAINRRGAVAELEW